MINVGVLVPGARTPMTCASTGTSRDVQSSCCSLSDGISVQRWRWVCTAKALSVCRSHARPGQLHLSAALFQGYVQRVGLLESSVHNDMHRIFIRGA